ncbi:adenylate kinase family protein, partial [Patescibacteria group bacterium]
MNIIILGPQGSGKGTQGRLLAEEFGLYHLENGKILRELAKTNKRIKDMVDNGILVPDQEMIEIMENHLVTNKVDFGNIIFDGYPRNKDQYEALKNWLKKHSKNVDFAILLEIGEQTTIERLSSRRVHKRTGEIYNMITKPPVDIPQDELDQRDDDKPEAIKKRLETYNKQTKPMLDEYKKDG